MNANAQQSRIDSDPLAKTIQGLTEAMKADFGRVYESQYSDAEVLRSYRRRLYQKLQGYRLEAIRSAYETLVNGGAKFPPTIPELVSATQKKHSEFVKAEKLQAEADRMAALPAPTIQCNPMEMLAEAMANPQPQGELTRSEKLQMHEALVKTFGSKIRGINAGQEHKCAVSFCHKTGSLSSSLTGGGNFYCREHYREFS